MQPEPERERRHVWLIVLIGAVLLTVHSVILYYFAEHKLVFVAAIAGVIVLVVIRHLKLFIRRSH